jgi:predicted Zn-dependent protease
MSDRIDALLALLRRGPDSALLRFSLGSEYRAAGREEEAIGHLERAVELDPDYSAAWKLLGRAREAAGREEEALAALRTGIEVALRKGDRQAAKEMTVFLKRIEKRRGR